MPLIKLKNKLHPIEGKLYREELEPNFLTSQLKNKNYYADRRSSPGQETTDCITSDANDNNLTKSIKSKSRL